MGLSGKTAVITGGGRGIGRAIARRLAEAGADLVVGDLNKANADETVQEMRRRFQGKAESVALDVIDSDSVSRLASHAEQVFGHVDIWVNNAGVFPSADIIETTDQQWEQVVDLNLRGTFFGCREAGKRMVQSGGGVIINITSGAGYRGRASIGHYSAAKHGVVGLPRTLAVELGPKGGRAAGRVPTGRQFPRNAGARSKQYPAKPVRSTRRHRARGAVLCEPTRSLRYRHDSLRGWWAQRYLMAPHASPAMCGPVISAQE